MHGLKDPSKKIIHIVGYIFAYLVTISLIVLMVFFIKNNISSSAIYSTDEKIMFGVIGFICISIGIGMLVVAIKKDINKISKYKITFGKCTKYDYTPSISNELDHTLTITYVIGENVYELKEKSNFGKRNLEREYKVYYDPLNPSKAFISWGIKYNFLWYLVCLIPMLAGILLFTI